MDCLRNNKRRAECGELGEIPCKVLKGRGGRRVVIDPDDDVLIEQGHHQEPRPAANGRKRERADHEDDGKPQKRPKVVRADGVQPPNLMTTQNKRPSPKAVAPAPRLATPQQQGKPKSGGLSFFHTIQRKGMKPIPPQQDTIRKDMVRVPAAAPKAQPAEPKTVKPKGPRQSLPHSVGMTEVPKGRSAPSAPTTVCGLKETVEMSAAVKTASAGSPKRKAEEQTEEQPPAKKPATAKPKELSWIFTGKLKPTTTHKRFFQVEPKTTKTKASHSEKKRKATVETVVKVAETDTDKAVNNTTDDTKTVSAAEKQTSSEGVKPPGLHNLGNSCFASSMLQGLYQVKEFREHFISRHRQCADKSGDKSISNGLGRLFQKMSTAVREVAGDLVREFLRVFGERHHQYDGSRQQEAYDFLEKMITELRAEEANSNGPAAPDVPLMKELFAGQMTTMLECGKCGEKRETGQNDGCWSIRLEVPGRCPNMTISDLLRRSLATQVPEGFVCEKCGAKSVTSKTDRIKSWGKYLLLNCDRAILKGKAGTKIPIPKYVSLDEHMLDRRPSTSDMGKILAKQFPDFQYEVVAFAEHGGARRSGGHYTATVRGSGGRWYHCDDHKVSGLDRERDLQATTATVVILKRC